MTRHLMFVLGIFWFAGCKGSASDTTDTDTDVADTDTTDTDTTDTDTADTDTTPPPLAIDGDWASLAFSDYAVFFLSGYAQISDTRWVEGSSGYQITQYDNDNRFLIAQNDSNNSQYPDQFSRYDWMTGEHGQVWFCHTTGQAASEEAALATAAPDGTDPANGGCGNRHWNILQVMLPIDGTWNDGFADHVIEESTWNIGGNSNFLIRWIAPTEDYLIAQNHWDNPYFPELWSRFDWHIDDTGAVYYCQSAYNAADQAAAEAVTGADASDMTAGCGGFAWSLLTPVN